MTAEVLHSIGDVAEATGLSTETLRMWERRYGRPHAVRLPSGHRRYTDAQVRWLRRVAEALARGHRPHAVVGLDEAALDALLAPAGDGPGPDEGETGALLAWTRSYDAARLLDRLRGHWDPRRPLAFLEAHVAPYLEALGRAWADGDVEIRHEHFASALLEDLMRELRAGYQVPAGGPRVLLATLSGELHALGLQMAALLCAARGVAPRVLGVDTPEAEIVAAARELGAQVVGVGISLANGGVDTDRRLAALREALPDDVRLVVGGAGARGVRRGPRRVEYVDTLAGWDAEMATLAAGAR